MKIYISADMEGVSGVVEAQDTQPSGSGYEASRIYMTEDINAAIRGLFAGGAKEVVVNDAHGPMRNILPEKLDNRAILIRGKSKPFGMIEGLDNSFDAVMCIGFHARAGRMGLLSHSFMGHEVEDIRLDGKLVGEIGLLHAAAASLGVPVVMLSGDDAACREMEAWDSQVITVATKQTIDRFAAKLLPITKSQHAIEAASKRALEEYEDKAPSYPAESTLTIRWQSASVASHLAGLPHVTLKDDRTIKVQGSIIALYQQLFIFFKVASSLTNQQPYC